MEISLLVKTAQVCGVDRRIQPERCGNEVRLDCAIVQKREMADFDRPREQLFRPLENRLDVWHFYMNIERGGVDEVFVKYEDIRIVLITVKVVVDAARPSAGRRGSARP